MAEDEKEAQDEAKHKHAKSVRSPSRTDREPKPAPRR